MTGDGGIGRRLREAWYASPLHAWRISGEAPQGLAVALTDPWPGDADSGREILEGAFPVAGQLVHVGADPWRNDGLTDGATEILHRFEWLRDLRDLGGDAARRKARDLVGGWIESFDRWDRLAWRADVLAARLAAWVATFGFFAESAEEGFRDAVLASLARQHRHLLGALSSGPTGIARIEALRGAIVTSVALGQDGDRLQSLLDRLEAALRDQVLADGGHRARSPRAQMAVLACLVDSRAALRAAGRESTGGLDDAIGRMTGVLRMLRHGDGGLALFNGATEGAVWRIDSLLARTESKVRAVASASDTGFERLSAGRAVAIMDTGVPTESEGLVHAGTLSFELSVGKERLIVNCGAAPADPRWEGALRATAAHSTLIIDDTNSTEIDARGAIGRCPSRVRVERWEADGAVWVEAEHDGYAESHGVSHRRRLYMAAGGDDLRGEDVLTYSGGPGVRPSEAVIRFHLHPRVAASVVQNGGAALLRTASGAGWRLRSAGGALQLHESVYFGDRGILQRCRQLVLTVPAGAVRDDGTLTIKWALRREDRRAA
ncbi:heparinase [Thalassobaculum fulvum]|uniref:Heparinase n=1 Tax=Thalassobaculum fulvum TaxID=1633335 RepID=A0A918XTU4_9PROT|nr:heparinase II/III family protein [Thalassobaculum fulvum]GHD55048.1 heparinase [Thalassobaculum fulvum]